MNEGKTGREMLCLLGEKLAPYRKRFEEKNKISFGFLNLKYQAFLEGRITGGAGSIFPFATSYSTRSQSFA